MTHLMYKNKMLYGCQNALYDYRFDFSYLIIRDAFYSEKLLYFFLFVMWSLHLNHFSVHETLLVDFGWPYNVLIQRF